MQYFIKRLLDIIASFVGIVLLLPFFLLSAAAIKLDDSGPVFFRQERTGQNRRIFKIFKFRTMVQDAEKKGAGVFVEMDDPRITRVGKFLRRTSLDELPQLFNIFKGDMSLVGPRPTLAYQVEKYNERQLQRLSVKPGITGWAQVHGRSALTWPERIELDLWYIDNWSFLLDIKILIKTLGVVLGKKNLYKPVGYDPISGEMKSLNADKDDEG